jgi:hypothetical protein
VHSPPATSVTVDPDTVHTAVVCELKLTGKFEVADALTVNGAVPYGSLGNPAKVIVWLHCTVVVADASTEVALLALAVAVLAYTPQLPAVVVLVTCTEADPPDPKLPKLQLRVPLAIEQLPGPLYPGLIVQLIPVPAGSGSLSAAADALPVPMLLAVSVYPIELPAETVAASAVFDKLSAAAVPSLYSVATSEAVSARLYTRIDCIVPAQFNPNSSATVALMPVKVSLATIAPST